MDNISKLYADVSKKKYIGTENQIRDLLSTKEGADKFYNVMKKHGVDLGNHTNYMVSLGHENLVEAKPKEELPAWDYYEHDIAPAKFTPPAKPDIDYKGIVDIKGDTPQEREIAAMASEYDARRAYFTDPDDVAREDALKRLEGTEGRIAAAKDNLENTIEYSKKGKDSFGGSKVVESERGGFINETGRRYDSRAEAEIEQNRIDQMKSQVYRLSRMEEQLGEMKDRSDELLEESKKGDEKQFSQALGMGPYYGSMMRHESSQTAAIRKAQADLDDAQEALNELYRQRAEGGETHFFQNSWDVFANIGKGEFGAAIDSFLKARKDRKTTLDRVGRGFKDVADDLSNWDFGMTDAQNEGTLLSAILKRDNGQPLTKQEQFMLDAAALRAGISSEVGDLGLAYTAGNVTAGSLPFMIEMMANPLSGLGKGATKALTKYAVKKYGREAVKNNMKKYLATKAATRVTGDIVGSLGMTATTGIAGTVANARERQIGSVQTAYDENGNIVYGGHVGGEDALTAYTKAIADRTFENWSEMSGAYFAALGAPIKAVIGKGIGRIVPDKVLQSDFAQWATKKYGDLKNSKFYKGVDAVKSRAQIGGLFEEYLEEKYGDLMRLSIGDTTFDTDSETGIFNLERNVETLVSLIPTQVGFGMLRLGGARTANYQYRQQRKAADKYLEGVLGEDWKGFRSQLDAAQYDPAAIAQIYTSMNQVGESNLPINVRRAVISYINAQQSVLHSDPALYQSRANNVDVEEKDGKITAYDKDAQGNILSSKTFETREEADAYAINRLEETRDDDMHRFMQTARGLDMLGYNQLSEQFMQERGFDNMTADEQAEFLDEMSSGRGKTGKAWTKYKVKAIENNTSDTNFAISSWEQAHGLEPGTIEDILDRKPTERTIEESNILTEAYGMLHDLAHPQGKVHVDQSRLDGIKFADEANLDAVLGTSEEEAAEVQPNVDIPAEMKAMRDAANNIALNTLSNDTDMLTLFGEAMDMNGADAETVIGALSSMDERTLQNTLLDVMNDGVHNERFQSIVDAVNAQAAYDAFVQRTGEKIDERAKRETSRRIFNGSLNGSRRTEKPTILTATDGEHTYQITNSTDDITTDKNGSVTSQGVITAIDENGNVAVFKGSPSLQISGEEESSTYEEIMRQNLQESVSEIIEPTTGEEVATENTENAVTAAAEPQTASGEVQEEKPSYTKSKMVYDEKGNEAFDRMPIADTMEELLDGQLEDSQVEELIDNNIEAYAKEVEKLNEKKPKKTTSRAELIAATNKLKADRAEAERKLKYWQDVKAELAKITHTTEEEVKAVEDELNATEETDESNMPSDAMSLASLFISDAKITPESFRSETGYGTAEQRKFMGIIATQAKGGKSIERLAEELVSLDNSEYGGIYFGGNSSEARNAIIAALQSARTRADLKANAMTNADVAKKNYESRRDEAYLDMYGMTYEDYIASQEVDLRDSIRKEAKVDTASLFAEADEAREEQTPTAEETENARREPLRQKAREWSEKTGVDVVLLESIDDVESDYVRNQIIEVEKRNQQVKGWYDDGSGRVFIYMPHAESEADVEATFVHEVVSHKGLRELLGDKAFDALCDNVFEMMSPEAQAKFLDYVGAEDINNPTEAERRAAADEYIAHLAEKTDLTDAEKSVWDNIVKMIRTALETLGLSISITDDVLSNLIKASYAEMVKNSRSEESVDENEGSEKQGVRFSVKDYSERFDRELQQQIDGALPKGHVYDLGMPSVILKSCGSPDMPIELSSTNLAEHARKTRHPFELKDVMGLVDALQSPIAVFKYGDEKKSQNVIIEIQKNDRNFLVGIHFNQVKNGLEVSSVRGIFPKDNAEWLNWINQGKAIYLDKEKIQALIDQQRKNLADVEYLDLDSAAKIIEDFENPKLSEENVTDDIRFRFIEAMDYDEINEELSYHSEWSDGAYNVMSALEEYYGGEIVHASRGARNAINEGRVPVPGPKYSGDNEEYHHFEFKNEDEESFVESVPFVKAENVADRGIRFRFVGEQGAANTRFRIANDNQEIFVSNAEQAVKGIKQDKATPQQWKAMIQSKGGLKAGEDKWLGLSEWLDEQATAKRSLTKQEVLDFIGENKIRIEEVEYGDANGSAVFASLKEEYDQWLREEGSDYAWEQLTDRYGDDAEIAFWDLGGELAISNEEAAAALLGENVINSTRLEYTTEGLENKREIALTVPTIESWNESDDIHFGDAGQGRAVAWARFGETTDSEGNSVLVIDEIQSKRHQEGREKGYRDVEAEKREKAERERELTEVVLPRLAELNQLYNEKYGVGKWRDTEYDRQWRPRRVYRLLTPEEQAEHELLSIRATELQTPMPRRPGVPDAPFAKNWHELAMKRMLRLAAEEGFDKVAWTKGAQQAERFDLGGRVDEIKVTGGYDGIFTVIGRKDGGILVQKDVEGEQGLADMIGKDLARKAYSNLKEGKEDYLNEDGAVSFTGDNLSIGGEGMKGFYDNILPRFMNKYGKKWGVKVGEVELPELEESGRTMWSVDVTPEMKESVMEGQVMFRTKKSFEAGDGYGVTKRTVDNYYESKELVTGEYQTPHQLLEAVRNKHEEYAWKMNDDATEIECLGRWNELLPKTKKNGRNDKNHNERIAKKTERAKAMIGDVAKMLGLDVEVLEDTDNLTGKKKTAKGWYEVANGKIVVVLPNHTSNADVMATLLHEGVAHYGLRKMFGEDFDNMLDNVYEMSWAQEKIDALAGENASKERIREATEEYLASLAEDINFEKATEQKWWDYLKYLKEAFVSMLRKAGITINVVLTDNELRYLLWRSYQNLKESAAFDEVRDSEMQQQLGVVDGISRVDEALVVAEDDVSYDKQGNPIDSDGTLILEEIRDVNDLTDEDFNEPTRSVVLPVLPELVDTAIGANGKRVIIKKNIFEKNKIHHKELSPADSRDILKQALYNPSMYGQNQKVTRPYNWLLIHVANKNKAVLLEVNSGKDYLEIINWHYLSEATLRQKERQAIKKGGRILTLASAAGNTLDDLSSERKDTENNPIVQENSEKILFRTVKSDYADKVDDLNKGIEEKGLRGHLGEVPYKKMMREVYEGNDEIAQNASAMLQDKEWNLYDSIETYLADEAQTMDNEEMWQDVRQSLADAIDFFPSIKDTKYAMWLNKNRDNDPSDPNDGIKRNALLYKLEREERETPVRFRTTPTPVADQAARAQYEKALKRLGYRWSEQWIDGTKSVSELQKAMFGKDFHLADSRDAHEAEKAMTSKIMQKQQRYHKHLVEPLGKAIEKCMKDMPGKSRKKRYENLKKYMYALHGLERNRYIHVRDFVDDEQQLEDYVQYCIQQRQELDNGNIDLPTYFAYLDSYIRQNIDKDFDADSIDKSGVHKLFPTDADALYYIVGTEGVLGKERVNELWRRVRDVNDFALETEYQSGLISGELKAKLASMYGWYIPLRGFEEETAEEAYDYVSTSKRAVGGPTVMRARGRKSKADDPIATMLSIGSQAIHRAERNEVKKKFYRAAKDYMKQNGQGGLVSELFVWEAKVGTDNQGNDIYEVQFPNVTENMDAQTAAAEIANFEARMQADPNARKVRQGANINKAFENRKSIEEHIVRVYENGEVHVLYLNGNPRAAQSLNGTLKFSTGIWGSKSYRKLQRAMSQMMTSLNITFALGTNPARDFQTTLMNTLIRDGVKAGIDYTKEYIKNMWNFRPWNAEYVKMFHLYRKNELDMNNDEHKLFKEFADNGGITGFIESSAIEDYKDMMDGILKTRTLPTIERCVDNTVYVLGYGNNLMENMARFATYKAARKRGLSIQKSVKRAKDYSLNFNQRGLANPKDGLAGALAYGFNLFYLFVNPTMQSFGMMLNNFKNHPAKTLFYQFALPTMMASMIVPVLNIILASWYDDDDDDDIRDIYGTMPEWKRRNNICIYRGKGEWNTIPLPLELRGFYAIGEILASELLGDTPWGKSMGWDKMKSDRPVGLQVADIFLAYTPLSIVYVGGGIEDEQDWKMFAPQWAKPVLEVRYNKSWTGAPIWNDADYLQHYPEWQKAYSNTNPYIVEFCRWLNETTGGDDVRPSKAFRGWGNLNPAKIDHLLKGYASGPYKFVNKLTTVFKLAKAGDKDAISADKLPITEAFWYNYDEAQQSKRYNALYYKYKEEAEETTAWERGYTDGGDIDGLLKLMAEPRYKRRELINDYETKRQELSSGIRKFHAREDEDTEEVFKRIRMLSDKAIVEALDKIK